MMSRYVARVTKVSDRLCLNILSTKQMIQRSSMALTQVKADNASENLLNEVRQIEYSF